VGIVAQNAMSPVTLDGGFINLDFVLRFSNGVFVGSGLMSLSDGHT
jgi:hypothetical protein